MAKDRARERNKPFYAKTKVNASANFEDGEMGGLAIFSMSL